MKRKRDQSRRRDDYDMIGRKTTRHGDMRVAGTGISGWNLNCKCAGGYTKRIDDVRRVRRYEGHLYLHDAVAPWDRDGYQSVTLYGKALVIREILSRRSGRARHWQ